MPAASILNAHDAAGIFLAQAISCRAVLNRRCVFCVVFAAQGLSGHFAWNPEVSSNLEIVQFDQDSLAFSSHVDVDAC